MQKKPSQKIRQIDDILDDTPLFPESMLPFFKWIAAYYVYPLGQVIQCALPAGLTHNDVSLLVLTDHGKKQLSKSTLPDMEYQVMEWISRRPRKLKDVYLFFNKQVTRTFIQSLVKKNRVVIKKSFGSSTVKPKLERFIALLDPTLPEDPRAVTRKSVIEALHRHGELSVARLKSIVPTAANVLKPLAASGQIKITHKKMYRDPFGDPISKDSPPDLTQEQNQVVSEIIKELGNGYKTYLLSGVTGSGKTEVYMHLAAETLGRGYQVLVLVPEIALISQVERRFRARFGEQVAILHSGLSKGERFDQWMRIREKKHPSSLARGQPSLHR